MQDRARHAAKHELTQAGMAITTHDDEICVGIGGMRKQYVGDIEAVARNTVDLHLESMTGEVLPNIRTFNLPLLAALVADHDHLDAAGSLKQRHGVGDGARGRS